MAKHKSKDCLNLIEEMVERLNFRIHWTELNSKGWLYPPEKDYKAHRIHIGSPAYLPLLTYLKKYERWKKSIDNTP